jgi:disulfide bond formation protein DsbB
MIPKSGIRFSDRIMLQMKGRMIPKMPVPDLIRDGIRFSDRIVRQGSAHAHVGRQAPAAALCERRLAGNDGMLERHWTLARAEPMASAAVAVAVIGLATIAGFFFFQHVLGYPPCPLCLEQRYPFYFAVPLAALVLLGLSVGSSRKVLLAALLAISAVMLWNAGLGVYHSGIEWRWWPGPQDCSGAVPNFSAGGSLLEQMQRTRVIRCDEAPWRLFGLSLAGYNVLVSLSLAAVAGWGALAKRTAAGRPPG